MSALDESLDTMLQHARVALGPRKPHRANLPIASSSASIGHRTSRRALMAPTAEDARAVQSLLETTDVDHWVAVGQHGRASRHTSPDRRVISGAEGHDRRINPTLSRPQTPTHPGNDAHAIYRRGTTEDVLASIVVRGNGNEPILPNSGRHEPTYVAPPSPSPLRGQLGPSIGDRVSGYYSERVGAAAWGPNGELAIGFDDNDDPVVVVRPQSIHHAALALELVTQQASSSSASKVASVQTLSLEPAIKGAGTTELVLDGSNGAGATKGGTTAAGGTHGKPLPIPSPDAATSFKDVQHRFVNLSASSTQASPTQPPPPLLGTADTAASTSTQLQVPEQAQSSARNSPLDATRGPAVTTVDIVLEQQPSPIERTTPSSATGQPLRRQPSPREDHSTQTESQPAPPPPQLTSPLATGSVWGLASTEAFVDHTPLLPRQQQSPARLRQPLPLFTIPPHDDDILFAGPPQPQPWADDRDPAFVSAVVTHRPGTHRDVIPAAEFRKMIVNTGVPDPTQQTNAIGASGAAAPPQAVITPFPQHPVAQSSGGVGSSSRSASAQPLPNPTYFTFQEEFPAPPPPHPPKTKPTCKCW